MIHIISYYRRLDSPDASDLLLHGAHYTLCSYTTELAAFGTLLVHIYVHMHRTQLRLDTLDELQ